MARPTALDHEAADRIIAALRAGAPIKLAAEHAGVHERTYHRWVERGQREEERQNAAQEALEALPADASSAVRKRAEEERVPLPSEEPFRQFCQRTTRARAEGCVGHLAVITNAARGGDWRASAWFLERAHPEHYGRRSVQVHEGLPAPAVVPVARIDHSDPEVRRLAAELLSRRLELAEKD